MRPSRFFLALFMLMASAIILPFPASAQEKAGCYCAQYDYVAKKYSDEKMMAGVAKSSECDASKIRVEKPIDKGCRNDSRFTNCTAKTNANGKLTQCLCTDSKTKKTVDRLQALCVDDDRFKGCTPVYTTDLELLVFDKCGCQEARTRCRWASGKGESGGVMSDTDSLQSQAQRLDQFKKFTSVQGLVGQAIKILLSFIGSIMLALYIYAGILWMTAGGNSERIDTSKQVLVWTTLGVAVMLVSYLVITYVFKLLLTPGA